MEGKAEMKRYIGIGCSNGIRLGCYAIIPAEHIEVDNLIYGTSITDLIDECREDIKTIFALLPDAIAPGVGKS